MRKFLIIAVICAACLAGCGKQAQLNKTSIVLLNGGGTAEDDNQVMREIYSDFEKENPDISLNLISMPSPENVTEKVKEMISVGKMPNLIYIGETSMDTLYSFMVDQEYVIDIMPYIQQDEELKTMISQETLDRWQTEDGRLYTVTDVLNTGGYWYNKQIFSNAGIEKAPETWEEFLECCRKICQWGDEKKLDTVPLHLNMDTAAAIIQAGMEGEHPEDAGQRKLSQILDVLKKIDKYADAEKNYTYRDNLRSFNVGHCAICVGEIANEHMLNPNLQMEYAVFPSVDGSSVGFISSYPGYFIGSSCDEEQKKACVRFLKYMLSEKIQRRIWKETGNVPSNPNVDISGISRNEEVRYQAYQQLMKADVRSELPGNCWGDNALEEFQNSIFEYLSGDLSDQEIYEILTGSK